MEPWKDRVYVQHTKSDSTLFSGTVEVAHLWLLQYDPESLKELHVIQAQKFEVEEYLNCKG